MKMKISTEIGSASKIIGEEKAVEYIAKAGFDGKETKLPDCGDRHRYACATVAAFGTKQRATIA